MSKVSYHTEWQRANKEKLNEKARKLPKRLVRHYQLKKKYGISIDEYEDLVKSQNSVCAVCKGPPVGKKCLSVDHSHATGKIRGLLCTLCNNALGQAKDSPERLRALADYLERNS